MVVSILAPKASELWGSNLSNKEWIKLRQVIKQQIKELGCTEVLTSAKFGVEMIAAESALELKNEGIRVKTNILVPCLDYGAVWSEQIRERYKRIKDEADRITLLCSAPCGSWIEEQRCKYQVEHANVLLFVVGSSECGDMHEMRSYARKLEKSILIIKKSDIESRIVGGGGSA